MAGNRLNSESMRVPALDVRGSADAVDREEKPVIGEHGSWYVTGAFAWASKPGM
jgi:hypothetical protein